MVAGSGTSADSNFVTKKLPLDPLVPAMLLVQRAAKRVPHPFPGSEAATASKAGVVVEPTCGLKRISMARSPPV